MSKNSIGMDERYIAAVDLGTCKIRLSVAKVEGNDVQVIYYDEQDSEGMRDSHVYNPTKVATPLSAVIEKAEKELNIKILQAVVGLPRYYVRQESATGGIPRTDGYSNITRDEVDSVKNMALDDYPLADTKKEIIYEAVAQSFSTDENFQIMESDVEGMVSETLEGNFKVFIGNRNNVNYLDQIFNKLNIAIAKKYFVPDVVAKIVLTTEEMDNGVALIDFGGGVTSVSVYRNCILRHFASIPFGGENVTKDLKNEGGFSMGLAENIKLAFGACMPDKLASMSEKIIRICYKDSGAEKQLPVRYLSEIITYRMEEIIKAILYEIQMSGFADELRSGIVITGGGAEMVNLGNLIKEMSGYNVRKGYPLHKFSSAGCVGVNETAATAAIGMLIEAKNDRFLNCLEDKPSVKSVDEEKISVKDEEPDLSGSVFDENGWDTIDPQESPKKGKPTKRKGLWKVWGKVVDDVDKKMASLYDDMKD